MSSIPPDLTLDQFVAVTGATSRTRIALLILYYCESQRGQRSMTAGELRRAFSEARVAPPRNVSGTMQGPIDRHLVQRTGGRYALLQKGVRLARDLAEPALGPDAARLVADISPHLTSYLDKIGDVNERDYVTEAMSCLHIAAYRAAVVLAWAGAVFSLRRKIQRLGFDKFNAKFVQLYPKSRRDPVVSPEDLEEYKDFELLRVCNELGILTDTAHKHLKPQLDLRNTCGHPTQDKPNVYTVGSFFERIIQYVFSDEP
jgi:hypothetical protein